MGAQMLLIALVPLIVATSAVIILLTNSNDNLKRNVLSVRQETLQGNAGQALQDNAHILMREIDAYMRERLEDAIEWSNLPIVHQAALEGAARAEELGLTTLTETELENTMNITRAPGPDAELTAYLTELSGRTPAFVEMFFTDKHGFTVAYSNKPSDFVQAGETWWDTAWEKGSFTSNVAYDDSAGRYALAIAVRIDDADGQPLGVFKAVLDIQALQDMAAEAASRVQESQVRLFTHQGYQISDTASKNDLSLIMTGQGNLLASDWQVARQILDDAERKDGYLLDQQNLDGQPIVIGYAFSAPDSYYDVQGFDRFAWVVTMSQPQEIAMALPQGLSDVITEMGQTNNKVLVISLAIGALAAAGAVFAAYWASRRIARPIARLVRASQRISAGDLSTPIQIEQRNEIGELEAAFQQMTTQLRQTLESEREQHTRLQEAATDYTVFATNVALGDLTTRLILDEVDDDNPLVVLGCNLNDMVDSLSRMTAQTKDAALGLGAASAEILAATTQQVVSANAQSLAMSQTATSVDEVKTLAEQSVARAQQVTDTSQRTVEVSRSGRQAVQQTIASMAHIKTRVEGIAENILALSEQTQQIGEIIASVNDIAAQSNLLALNASVEAARAGEHGKGFAVVAVEVRNLAEQSRQATAQIKAILSDIQKATNVTVMATEEGGKGVDEGVRLAAQTQDVIEQLSNVIDESAQVAMQAVASGQQQASGVEQVALAIENINQATTQSLSSTRQAEKAAQELNDLARDLTEIVKQYQL